MKRRNTSLLLMMLFFTAVVAQEKNDTIVQFKDKTILLRDSADYIKVKVFNEQSEGMQKIYEGVFIGDISTEEYLAETRFDFSHPFKKKKNKKRVYGSFQGLYLGRMFTTDNFENFDEAGGFAAALSNEISANPFQYTLTLVPGFVGITSGVGVTLRNLHLDSGSHFEKSGTEVTVEPAPAGLKYRSSRLRTLDFNVPFYLDLQPTGRADFFISGGVLLGTNLFSSAKIRYRDDDNKKQSEVKGKDLFINPFSLSYVGQIGFDSVGVYAKYTPTLFFKEGRGPEFQTLSVGLVLLF